MNAESLWSKWFFPLDYTKVIDSKCDLRFANK